LKLKDNQALGINRALKDEEVLALTVGKSGTISFLLPDDLGRQLSEAVQKFSN
jgi:hypothetical protein